jgi:hypothetical protein
MGTGVSSQRVHWYRCQPAEGSWVQMSVHGVFTDTSVSPLGSHGYRCSWIQASVHRMVMGTVVSRTECSWIQVSVH